MSEENKSPTVMGIKVSRESYEAMELELEKDRARFQLIESGYQAILNTLEQFRNTAYELSMNSAWHFLCGVQTDEDTAKNKQECLEQSQVEKAYRKAIAVVHQYRAKTLPSQK